MSRYDDLYDEIYQNVIEEGYSEDEAAIIAMDRTDAMIREFQLDIQLDHIKEGI